MTFPPSGWPQREHSRAVQAAGLDWPGDHLLHEEQPARAADWVLQHMRQYPLRAMTPQLDVAP